MHACCDWHSATIAAPGRCGGCVGWVTWRQDLAVVEEFFGFSFWCSGRVMVVLMICSGGLRVAGRNVAVFGGGASWAMMEVEEVKMGSVARSDQMMDVADQVIRTLGFLRRPWFCNVY